MKRRPIIPSSAGLVGYEGGKSQYWVSGDLNFALAELAHTAGYPVESFIRYADEDEAGGWDNGEGDWHIGSMFSNDGRLLYALVRALRPNLVLELGVFQGCSSKHILSALVKNKKGKLISYDLAPQVDKSRFTIDELDRWILRERDVMKVKFPGYLRNVPLVFEDLSHEYEPTRDILRKVQALNPQMVISHDAAHHDVGANVRAAHMDVFGSCNVLEYEGSECGLAYHWRGR